ncbi:MAG: cytochrome c family protein [Myxococcales bacterium]|nr:cytochrome c family protein [Myxococcales bacterium]
MALLFRPKHNHLARLSLILTASAVVGGIGGILVYVRTPIARGMQDPVEQPIQFDHRHHVRDVGIDCRYCHQTVEKSAHAGIPPTELCLNCHSQVWNGSPMLLKVRESFMKDEPIAWTKVNDVPDFVYFNHSIHVAKGVGCVTCHGRVDLMPAVQKDKPLTMGWCLECHRNPGPNLRPVEEITNMEWTRPEGDAELTPEALVKRNDVHTRDSCTTCHR